MSRGWLALVVVHLAATGVMTGLIWTIHVLHYPLFDRIGTDLETYTRFQQDHMSLISRLLVVPWGVEAISAALVFFLAPTARLRWLALAAGVTLVVIVAITAALAAPIHGRLLDGFDADELNRLLNVNLWRALLWTLRLAMAAVVVWWSVSPAASR